MRRMKIFLPYVFVMLCGFYLLPLLLRSVVGETILLLVILPGLCLLCAVIYGWRHRISWLYPCVMAVLFVPAVFLFFDKNDLIYVAAYAVTTLAGCLIGTFLSGKKT